MSKPQPNICSAECPSRKILELLAEKWALLVVFRLRIKPHRTAELRREIGGVSEKMLIQTLRKLERHGLVDRHDFNEVPPRVEYTLSKLGQSLALPVATLERWVAGNIAEVLRAKERFDAKASKQPRRQAA
ncbi:MAG: helix-turn-helix transcriptional regulator [Candidatus Obscuribacterales bacterium]|nr:helix-turn-helix transcriptional regulator [Steroidobacteraceae bacterium]